MPESFSSADRDCMQAALRLAQRGEGLVEPNPMVGCLVVRDGQVVGEGWHQQIGGPHAEVHALQQAGSSARGGWMYVTLEPCCHHGKTPPCTDAILSAGIARVVVAHRDPFPRVDGGGLRQLQAAGVQVEVGLLAEQAQALNAPYLKRVQTGQPWLIAKWAMTLDGKLATRSGHSQWISNETSRAVAHRLRGRMDAVVVGRGTLQMDDPLLTARPAGPRTPLRVVLDSSGVFPSDCQLARTARETPVLVCVGPHVGAEARRRIESCGAEVYQAAAQAYPDRWLELLDYLGSRQCTNVLLEGGGQLLGTALDTRSIDEVHVFLAGRLAGGTAAPAPCLGYGVERMDQALRIEPLHSELLDGDLHLWGRVLRSET